MPRERRLEIALIALAVLMVGAAWGVGGQAADRVIGGKYLTALGAPWLVLAFLAGALLPRRSGPWTAAAAGAALLVAGVFAYYVVHALRRGFYDRTTMVLVVVAWSFAAVAAGGLFGAAGHHWRRTGHGWAGALPAAALLGEAFALAGQWRSPGAHAAVTLELRGGVALLAAVAARSRRATPVLAAAAGLAIVCGVAEIEVRELARAAGWSGL
jgi:hypothetical protein